MRFPLLAAALSLPFGLPVHADTQTVTLDPLVVTATRTPETEDQILASVSVIDREEIERRQFRSVPDALRGLPGVSISGSGGAGQPASLFLRGTNAGHVLVLIDGVKVGSATLGTAPLQDLPIAQVERIEVVRGPRSSLYGSEAIGGVIQIFTRRGGGPICDRASASAPGASTPRVSRAASRAAASVAGSTSAPTWSTPTGSMPATAVPSPSPVAAWTSRIATATAIWA